MSLTRISQLVAASPARHFGLYPRKGTLTVGFDADFAIMDMNKRQKVSRALLQSAQDFTPFEGVELTGWPTETILRGQPVFSKGRIVGKPGAGRYLKRPLALHKEFADTAVAQTARDEERAEMKAEEARQVLKEYQRKGLGFRVGFGRHPALLVVDMIVGFTDLASPLAAPLEPQLEATLKLLRVARRKKIPIIFSTVACDAQCREAGVFLKKVPSLSYLKAGSRWGELDPRLKRRPEEILLNKKFASCFLARTWPPT